MSGPLPAAALAGEWWFWALAAGSLLAAAVLRYRLRGLASGARAAALRRGLLVLPPGRALASDPGRGSDWWWLGIAAGIWTVLAPWTWGYDGAAGAIATDAVTGGAVIALSLAAIVFPALWAINLLAGLWLVTAPWVVGYGDANGPVGLSDSITGLVLAAVAIAGLATAERALRPGGGAIGRIRPRR